jgi:transposase
MEEGLGNRLVRQMKELAEVAGIKTEEYAKISRKRLDVLSLDRELGKEKAALGERVYELHRREGSPDVLQDVTVKACIARIQKLEESLAEVEREIQTIRGASQERSSDVRQRYADERKGAPPEAGTEPKP